jgi:hypothetical protein
VPITLEFISPGANPTIVSYNASAVKMYTVANSLAGFENKNILFYFEKCCRLLQRWRCSCKFKKIVGLGPGVNPTIVNYNASAVKK